MSVRYGIQLVALAVVLFTAACGGAGNLSTNPKTLSGPGSSGVVSGTAGVDTGYAGSVTAPGPASFGASPAPPQIAVNGAATFDGTAGSYPSGITFPVLYTALQYTLQPNGEKGLAPVSAASGSTITVPGAQNARYVLSVPLFVPGDCLVCDGTDASHLGLTNLSYVTLGGWSVSNQSQSAIQFLFGYETPASSVPAAGHASFSGTATGDVYVPANGQILQSHLSGDATLSVDFASGKITGGFTNTHYIPVGGNSAAVPWNDVSVNASIAAGTNRFIGATAVTSAPRNTMSLNSSATGSISGGLYGPAAQELGAIWTLNDGNASAIGGVLAHATH